MNRQAKQSCGPKNRTLRFGDLSLLPLKTALSAAEKESPARPPRATRRADPNEQLALQLIERMKKEYKKRFHFAASRGESILNERIPEMAGNDAG